MAHKGMLKDELLEEIKDLEKEVQALEEEQGECPNCDGAGNFDDCPDCDELRNEVRSLEDDADEKDEEIDKLNNEIDELRENQQDVYELQSISCDLSDLQHKIDCMI